MTSLYNSLAEVSTGYTIFEKDQVLTEAHLNSIRQYLDDQDRLSRVNLVGVGIVCGLVVNQTGSSIQLTAGTGITTDGDLVHFPENISFDRFKPYSTDAPKYPPLYQDDDNMAPAYELVAIGKADVLAQDLSIFKTRTGLETGDMTAVLLVESYIKDSDLCTGDDCDNRGQDYVFKNKLLLVDTGSISPLVVKIQSAEAAAAALPELVARRVLINGALSTGPQLNSRFLGACNTMVKELMSALPSLWTHAGFLLNDVFNGNPVNGWVGKLDKINSFISSKPLGTQYYYDFLKDIIDTWNDMRAALVTELSWCTPDINGFPKHLILGDMTDHQDNRFDFYRSAAITDDRSLTHGKFLAQKIHALINNFSLPQAGEAIRVTPSTLCRPLEERAIPYYYTVDDERSVVEQWNFCLSQRGMAAYNHSYRYPDYDAKGAAADPLQSSIDTNEFFRIEGHIGHPVKNALTAIESEIAEYNLPFAVTAVLLGDSHKDIVGKRGAGYTDLTRFHYLLRQDLSLAMKDVGVFNNNFKSKIDDAVNSGIVNNDTRGNDGTPVKMISDSKYNAINEKAEMVQKKMNLSYTGYRQDSSWKTDIADAMTSAGEYKFQLGKVVKTEFVTPFDSLIGSIRVDWLNWLDDLIDTKDKTQDEKRLLREFVKCYPGMEHTGGVIRGGTFVLVYNNKGRVVADFMLSHYLLDEVEAEAEEPSVPTPGIRPGWIIDSGVTILPSLDNYMDLKLEGFKLDLDRDWTQKFDIQTSYTAAFQNSIGMMTELFGKQTRAAETIKPRDTFDDKTLGLLTERATRDRELVQEYTEKTKDRTLPRETRKYYNNALNEKQKELAKSAADIAEHVSVTNADVTSGGEGYRALQEINISKELIKENEAAKAVMAEGIKKTRNRTRNTELLSGLDTILKF